MAQSLTEPLAEAAQAALRADRELDRVAWNLPRGAGEIGGYKRSPVSGRQPASEAAGAKSDAISAEAVSLDGWEDEGGAP